MVWWQSLLMTAGTVTVTFLVTAFLTGVFNIPKKKKREQEEFEARINARFDRIDGDIKLCMRANQVSLKNDLKVRYDHWLDEGYAPEDAKDDLEKEYQVYHSMGKNGVMDSRRAKFLLLPTDPDEEKYK